MNKITKNSTINSAVSGCEILRAGLNSTFEPKDARSVLDFALNHMPTKKIAVLSSFGADSAVLLHLVSEVDRHTPVVFLDTHQHFSQTLDYVDVLRRRFHLSNIRLVEPAISDVLRFDSNGDLHQTDPDSCCYIRKTAPLSLALEGCDGWISGRKRHQTAQRKNLHHFECSKNGRLKINPLAYWSSHDIDTYIHANNLPKHPLVALGYPSIGCKPCTAKSCNGSNSRAGRWAGTSKTECGIH